MDRRGERLPNKETLLVHILRYAIYQWQIPIHSIRLKYAAEHTILIILLAIDHRSISVITE